MTRTWQPYCIEGHAWEAFTYLWRGEATTLDEICRKLARRGYSREEYLLALEDLIGRGWVEERDGYQITTLGNEIRQTAEELTDQYFFSPWSCLTQAELETLRDLLIRLRDGLL